MRLLLSSVAILISTWSLANDLEDRVDELEMKSLLQSVQLGGELIVRHDSVTKNIQRNNEYKEYTYSLDRLRFRLNLSADLSDRVTFYGRFVASKAQNEIFPVDDQNDDPINRDQNGRAFRGADLYLERAYLNYKIMDGLVFSAGRLPIIEGGPYHLGYGEAPMGSYPLISYNNNFDGYALTYANSGFVVRGIYHPWSSPVRDNNNVQSPAFGGNGRQMGIGEMKVLNFEYSNKKLGFARNFTTVFQHFFAENLQLPDTLENPNGGLLPSSLTFDGTLNTLYVELFDLMNSGFSIGITHTATTIDTRGDLAGGALPVTLGFFSGKDKDTVTGSINHVMASYNMPVKALMNPTIGIEYSQTTDDYFYPNNNPIDPLRMLSNLGSVSHLFYVQPLDEFLKLRLGTIAVKPERSDNFFGTKSDLSGDAAKENSAAYAELRLKF